MSIVKRWKDSNLQPLPKRHLSALKSKSLIILPTLLLASLLGTYLDLFFVGKGIYSFPKRRFPEVFSIDITFTLIALPMLMGVFLYVCHKMKNNWQKAGLIFLLSLFMSVAEKQAEAWGFFIHQESWRHMYSYIGYIIFLIFSYSFYQWSSKT